MPLSERPVFDLITKSKSWFKFEYESLLACNKKVLVSKDNVTWDIIQTVYADLGNGRDMDLNGHLYQRKTNVLYDNAKELLEDLIMEDGACVVLDMLREMPETELLNLLSQVDRIDKHDGKLLLKYR